MKRFYLLITICSILGIAFGATTSEASINECLQAPIPTNECLTQDPLVKRIEGMSMGIFVGVGAALGASWGAWKSDRS